MLSSTSIAAKLMTHYRNGHMPVCHGVTLPHHFEADVACVTKDGLLVKEFEIKTSRSDFRADFNKEWFGVNKHRTMAERLHGQPRAEHGSIGSKSKIWTPNQFYFVVPHGMLTRNDIPEYAGWIEMDEDGKGWRIAKRPKTLHREPASQGVYRCFLNRLTNIVVYGGFNPMEAHPADLFTT